MTLNDFIDRYFISRTIINYLLLPLSFLVIPAAGLRRLLYRKVFSSYRAPVKVISIGNIIMGGSSKTPFTIYLAELLTRQGLRVGVSHRGYKSPIEKMETIISDRQGLLPEADKAGDEAWLIAKRLPGVPVVVGKKRKKAIELLVKTFHDLDCVILDDSFQHLQVKHDLDIIMVSARLGFGNGFVLPAGYLREPITALKYSDLIVLNKSDREEMPGRLSAQLKKSGKDVLTGQIRLDGLYDFDGRAVDLQAVKQNKMLLLTAIGNPNGFVDLAAEQDLKVAGKLLYIDHFSYKDSQSRRRILDEMQKLDARWIFTTEKDYAKLRHHSEFQNHLLVAKVSFIPTEAEATLVKSINSCMGK